MASRIILATSRRSLFQSQSPTFSQTCQLSSKPLIRSPLPKPSSPAEAADRNKKNRVALFTYLNKDVKSLSVRPHAAEKIYVDCEKMIAGSQARGDTVESADSRINIQYLCKKFKVEIKHLVELAFPISLLRGDPNKPTINMPQLIAKHLYLSCNKAKDPIATIQVCNAVYQASNIPTARGLASLFTTTELREFRARLVELATAGHPEAMTLSGQFMEREGSRQRARELYEAAMELQEKDWKKANTRSYAFPMNAPWNALGFMLLREQTAQAKIDAEAAFRVGALEADDPLSYYQLALLLEDKKSEDWLRFMSKAAASGKVEAMFALGNFYTEADPQTNMDFFTDVAVNKPLAKALHWILSWKPDRLGEMGEEWFRAAAEMRYTPAMVKMADISEARGDVGNTEKWLSMATELLAAGKTEQYPVLVETAKKRLQKLTAGRPREKGKEKVAAA